MNWMDSDVLETHWPNRRQQTATKAIAMCRHIYVYETADRYVANCMVAIKYGLQNLILETCKALACGPKFLWH